MATTSAQVQQLYVAYLGRAADKGGLDYWLGQLNATPAKITLEQIRANFVNEQPEYKAAYAGLDRVDTVTKIYNNLFGRAPDAGGLAYWTTGGGSTVAIDQLLVAFVNGASATDAKTITNKVLVSEVYTGTVGADGYLAADAKSILSGVTDSAQSVTEAVGKLSDGSLSGVAIPTSVALLKASITADAAVTAFETNKAADLLAIENQLVALTKANAALKLQSLDAGVDTTNYGAINTELSKDLVDARVALGGKTATTAKLSSDAALAVSDLAAKAAALKDIDPKSIDKITAYNNTAKALAAVKAADTTDVGNAVAVLAVYATTNATAWTKALTDAGVDTTKATTAALQAKAIYDYLAKATTSTSSVDTITKDLSGAIGLSNVTSLAAQDQVYNKAKAAFDVADGDLTNIAPSTAASDWKAAYKADADLKIKVAASTSLDTLESAYKAIDNAHTAATSAQSAAATKVGADVTLKALNTIGAPDTLVDKGNTGATSKADVFYFTSNKVTTADGALNFDVAKDSIYVGEGYTLNTTAKFDTVTGKIVGGQNGVKEVFFIKDTGGVKLVIETADLGSSTVANAPAATALAANPGDQVSVITLTGVTSVDQLAFANGVLTAHA